MAKWPQTDRSDVLPDGDYSWPKKKMGEHFDEAANRPNNPKKDHVMDDYNITDEYCETDDDSKEGD